LVARHCVEGVGERKPKRDRPGEKLHRSGKVEPVLNWIEGGSGAELVDGWGDNEKIRKHKGGCPGPRGGDAWWQ